MLARAIGLVAAALVSLTGAYGEDSPQTDSDRERRGVLFTCDFQRDDWFREWGERRPPQRADLVATDPERKFEPLSGKALRIKVDEGGHYGVSLTYQFKQQAGYEPDEVYFCYDLRLADDWSPARGGKLPGIAGTYGRAGWGGRPVNGRDGWSARGLFRGQRDGKTPIGFYCYHMDMRGRYGSEWIWDREDRGLLENNRWHSIQQHVKLNTPGQRDGMLRGWVDGELAFERSDLRFRETDALKIETVWLNVYLGGSWTAESDHHLYVDNVVIATEPIAER